MIEVSVKDKIYEQNILTNVYQLFNSLCRCNRSKHYGQDLWTKHTNERFINYSIVCVGVIEVSIKDKIYEQNILTNVYQLFNSLYRSGWSKQ